MGCPVPALVGSSARGWTADRRRLLRRVCSLKGWKDETKWIKAAQDLNLTAEQQTRALSLRTTTLKTLQR